MKVTVMVVSSENDEFMLEAFEVKGNEADLAKAIKKFIEQRWLIKDLLPSVR